MASFASARLKKVQGRWRRLAGLQPQHIFETGASVPFLRWMALFALAGTPGCFTGHLMDAGLRYEKVDRYESVCVAGDRLVVGYVARLETARGKPVSERVLAAAVSLSELAGEPPPSIDTLDVEWVEVPEGCEEVALVEEPSAGTRPEAHAVNRDGAPFALVLSHQQGPPATVYAGTFTRSRTALWVVPVIPFAVAADAVASVPFALLATPYLFFDE